jgi:hypothetical protein
MPFARAWLIRFQMRDDRLHWRRRLEQLFLLLAKTLVAASVDDPFAAIGGVNSTTLVMPLALKAASIKLSWIFFQFHSETVICLTKVVNCLGVDQ